MKTKKTALPATGKGEPGELTQQSHQQAFPSLASPYDFQITENGGLGGTETLPFNGSCGGTPAEYRKLLKQGRAENKFAFVAPDDRGRTKARE